MRKFSDFRRKATKLKEDVGGDIATAGRASVGPMNGPTSSDDVEVGAHNVHEPEVLARVNQFVGAIGMKPYINPYYAIHRLWTKLQIIGLGFDLNSVKFIKSTDTLRIPLTQYGGRYGFTDMDGVVKHDDGISHRIPGGLQLVITYVTQNGLTTMEGQVEKGLENPSLLALGEEEAKEPSKEEGAEQVDELTLPSFLGGTSYIGKDGAKVKPASQDPAENAKAKLVKFEFAGGVNTFSVPGSRQALENLRTYLTKTKPRGKVKILNLTTTGKPDPHLTREFTDWKQAAEHLEGYDNPTKPYVPSHLVKF